MHGGPPIRPFRALGPALPSVLAPAPPWRRWGRRAALAAAVLACGLGWLWLTEVEAEALPLAGGGALPVAVVASPPPAVPPEPAADVVAEVEPLPPELEPFAGEASYYASGFEGRPTASREPNRGRALTAAHRTLPFGTRVRVTNRVNDRSVVVRINDRGPFHRRRVIDLSRAAAEELGMVRRGRVPVEVQVLAAAG
jgi:rare lipoprotein A